jgi:hypothetical protein
MGHQDVHFVSQILFYILITALALPDLGYLILINALRFAAMELSIMIPAMMVI